MSRQPVGMDELVEHWTVLDDELELVAGKRGGTRLGFALLLKHYTRHGRNVVESWNAAHAVIYYGKGGEISTNRREEVEMAALCLRILQASLVYINTLMLQDVLTEPRWSDLLTPADRRGLTPLFWTHVRPYGEVKPDMRSRPEIGGTDLGGLG
ncbi:hypothetical protein E1265_24100 [Streptomyces sp. 8K308]|uniref:Tn3 family transposase n=1 Tax=Streptomyces sp. 8K308 TaxID=2530388 RepID=UPI00104746B7|nr:Tn3 family transposase [Streptomyces sp. 8K308]TDC19328.1 hypothetical protein E1265_24100 [Streptomyces sp. 8K308]